MKKTSRKVNGILAAAMAALIFVSGVAPVYASTPPTSSEADIVTIGKYTYASVSEYSEGFALATTDPFHAMHRYYSFIDHNGAPVEMVRGNYFYNATPFSEGLAAVQTNEGEQENTFDMFGGRWFYIDHNGEKTFDTTFKWADSFSEGFAVVELDNSNFGFIDHSGKLAFDMEFKTANPFSLKYDGVTAMAYVQFTDGHWGYLFVNGETIVID